MNADYIANSEIPPLLGTREGAGGEFTDGGGGLKT